MNFLHLIKLPSLYVLNEKNEMVQERSFLKWAKWMNLTVGSSRVLAKTKIATRGKFIVTVFFGIDQSLDDSNKFFKTTVFIYDLESDTIKQMVYENWYSTYDEAIMGHDKICINISEGI